MVRDSSVHYRMLHAVPARYDCMISGGINQCRPKFPMIKALIYSALVRHADRCTNMAERSAILGRPLGADRRFAINGTASDHTGRPLALALVGWAR